MTAKYTTHSSFWMPAEVSLAGRDSHFQLSGGGETPGGSFCLFKGLGAPQMAPQGLLYLLTNPLLTYFNSPIQINTTKIMLKYEYKYTVFGG